MSPLAQSIRPFAIGATRALVTPVARAWRFAGRLRGRTGRLPVRPDRILVVAIGYLGDTILTLPLLEALRTRWPEARIDVWCRHRTAELFARRADPDSVLACDDVASDRNRDSSIPPFERRELMRSLRARRYDLIVDTCGVPGTTLAACRAGARCVVGTSDQGLAACYDLAVPYDVPGEHLYDRRRRLAALVGLELPDADTVELGLGWPTISAPPGGWPENAALLHVGAGWPAKLWPPERWGDLARLLRDQGSLTPVLHHGPGEGDLAVAAATAAGEPRPQVMEGSKLSSLAARVAASRVVVAADSGPGHLAAALGIPVVSLFGQTDPRLCRPLAARGLALVARGGVMDALSPTEVLSATLELARGVR